jgi:hypothetical protein
MDYLKKDKVQPTFVEERRAMKVGWLILILRSEDGWMVTVTRK